MTYEAVRSAALAALDNSKQPKDEDQYKQAAKTDVHRIPPIFILIVKR
jgi:hypothetical protein